MPLLQRRQQRPVLPRKRRALVLLPVPIPAAPVGREIGAEQVRNVRLLAEVHACEAVARDAREGLDERGLADAWMGWDGVVGG